MNKITKNLILNNVTKLEKCPVCGSHEIRINPACLSEEWLVECINCFAHTQFYTKQKEAAKAWNNQLIFIYPENKPYWKGE